MRLKDTELLDGSEEYKNPTKPEQQVDVIDIHPRLLTKDWIPYGAWVLHHEFVHALGYTAHDSTFRSLENLWPSPESSTMGFKISPRCCAREKGEVAVGFVRHAQKEYPKTKTEAKEGISAVNAERF